MLVGVQQPASNRELSRTASNASILRAEQVITLLVPAAHRFLTFLTIGMECGW